MIVVADRRDVIDGGIGGWKQVLKPPVGSPYLTRPFLSTDCCSEVLSFVIVPVDSGVAGDDELANGGRPGEPASTISFGSRKYPTLA